MSRLESPCPAVLALVALAIGLMPVVGCAGGDPKAASTAPTTAATTEPTTTAPEDPPPSPREKRYVRELEWTQRSINRAFLSGTYVTRASLQRNVRAFRRCREVVRAPSERFETPALIARDACKRLLRAAKAYERAIAVSDASGATYAGTEEARIFDRALRQGGTDAGNALNRLAAAVERARSILRSLRTSS